jgi:hypothetical protein
VTGLGLSIETVRVKAEEIQEAKTRHQKLNFFTPAALLCA